MEVEVIMKINVRDRRTVPTTVTGYVGGFECNGHEFSITQTIRGMSFRVRQQETEREAEIDLRAVAMVMAAMLLEHGEDIDREIH